MKIAVLRSEVSNVVPSTQFPVPGIRARVSRYSLLVTALFLASCGPTSKEITVDDLKYRMSILASDSLEGRRTGEPGAAKAAEYISRQFQRIGLLPPRFDKKNSPMFFVDTEFADSTYYQRFEFSERQFDSTKTGKTKGMNVIGILEGSDPDLRDQAVIIGAHYDHLGRGGRNALDSSRVIHYGADDNASGTAGVLELAEYFAKETDPKKFPKRTLIFMAFSGEEEGLFGSQHYTKEPLLPLEKTQAMINMDMIGRMSDSNVLILEGIGTSPVWKDLVNSFSESKPFQLRFKPDGVGPSDHSPFYRKGVPVLFFFTGLHKDYHKATDTKEKINYNGQKLVLDLARRIIENLASRPDTLSYTIVPEDTTKKISGFKVYVGGVPDYGYDGEGLKISDVTPNSPAQKAGLRAEDIIIKFGETPIRNIYDYTGALSKYKPDDVVNVIVKRGSETLIISLTLGTRSNAH